MSKITFTNTLSIGFGVILKILLGKLGNIIQKFITNSFFVKKIQFLSPLFSFALMWKKIKIIFDNATRATCHSACHRLVYLTASGCCLKQRRPFSIPVDCETNLLYEDEVLSPRFHQGLGFRV